MQKITPAYHATNLRALSFGEMMRLGGLFNGLMGFVIGRFLPPQGRELMPPDYDAMEAQRSDIAPHILERLDENGQVFLSNGFREIGYQVTPGKASESGGIIYLSDCGEIVGLASCVIQNQPAIGYINVGAVCSYDLEGRCVSVGNSNFTLDPVPGNRVKHCKGKPVTELLPILRRLKQESRAEFKRFANWQQVREQMRYDDTRSFLHRRDERKLFVPVE